MKNESLQLMEPTATADDYRRELLNLRDDRSNAGRWDTWVRLLECQYAMPGRMITATQLAKRAKLASYREASLRYDGLGHALATRLGYEAPRRVPRGTRRRWWMTLSTAKSADDDDANFDFTMRPALAEALENMGWVRSTREPEES